MSTMVPGEDDKKIFDIDIEDIGVRGAPVEEGAVASAPKAFTSKPARSTARKIKGKNKNESKGKPMFLNIESFDKPMKKAGSSDGSKIRARNVGASSVVDDSMENSDWFKKLTLDIPGIDSLYKLEKFFKIPEQGQERADALKKMKENYQWLDAVLGLEAAIIDQEIEKHSSKNNATD